MHLLVLGGTKYVGRNVVEHAIAAGHHVTLFNRGHTAPDLFPGVTRLVGDRAAGDLTALATGEWDGVLDFSGFFPRTVGATARLLADRVGHYTFMSSIAVYPSTSRGGLTESDATCTFPSGTTEPTELTADNYGILKADCERLLERAMPGRATSVRSGLVPGPGDPFGAFTSWALGMAEDDEVPCAARPEQPVQHIDIRDLAAFLVLVTLDPRPGAFNVVAPPVTFADLLETFRRAGDGHATVRWNRDENINEHGAGIVQPRDGSDDGAFRLSSARAIAAGLRHRPLVDTARDVIAWARTTRPTYAFPH